MTEKKDVVTDERMEKYLDITARALAKIEIAAPEKSYNRRLADSFLEMANCYYADAKHFKECGDYVTAFAAVNYAAPASDSSTWAATTSCSPCTSDRRRPRLTIISLGLEEQANVRA